MSFILEIITSFIFLLGSGVIFWLRKKSIFRHTFLTLLMWAFLVLTVYTLILEVREGTFFLVVPAGFFGVFAISYFSEKRKLINGLLFNLFLASLAFYYVMVTFRAESIFLGGILLVGGILFVLVLGFGVYGLIGFLYWNGLTVLKKESLSLANLLTLLLGVALTVYLFIQAYVVERLPDWGAMLFGMVPFLLFYFFVVFFNFLTISILYQFNRPKYDQDYIIVLGAGLLRGEDVSPLLAGRIKRAIDFYHAQETSTQHPLKLVMSGGQGNDEKISEALAMKNYTLEQGIPEEDILVETQSKTTLENMQFSKQLLLLRQPQPFKVIFSSNNYHIFRAGMFAREARLKADGIGAKTAGYFLPNAFLREFIAIVAMRKKRHAVVCGMIVLLFIFLAIMNVIAQ